MTLAVQAEPCEGSITRESATGGAMGSPRMGGQIESKQNVCARAKGRVGVGVGWGLAKKARKHNAGGTFVGGAGRGLGGAGRGLGGASGGLKR